MNRWILRHGKAATVVILAVFAWVIWRRMSAGGVQSVTLLAGTALVVWAIGTVAFIGWWPRITVNGLKRVLTRRGVGDSGPIPVNAIRAASESPSQSAAGGGVLATGADDLLYVGGWVDVGAGPQVLRVPEMRGRYFSIQFTDPATGADFAYVGTRTTGSAAGRFLLCPPAWRGVTPDGTARIDIPRRAALLIGRVFVADEDDRPDARALAEQICLEPPAP